MRTDRLHKIGYRTTGKRNVRREPVVGCRSVGKRSNSVETKKDARKGIQSTLGFVERSDCKVICFEGCTPSW